MNIQNKKLWLALATVAPFIDNNDLNGAKGAVFNVLFVAKTKKEFKEKVRFKLLEFGYVLENLEDIEPFDFKKTYGDNLNNLAEIALQTENIQWGTFYIYD
ncbi:hypothetical protein [Dysgonomonas gadei]|uniref:Uncharacterized protein n=1 Tax=Dysgonomonas gadei ATCC BAA-286 TaxID=742766 RepID=F5IXK9_9BACT|nr:hypothetical protein [Dysgonomonas gadei]EGK02192.1 hypothetical protein HMPREF9455_01826 [Dysgonomonas gadei ATCC BAA-286]